MNEMPLGSGQKKKGGDFGRNQRAINVK
jgi:hypothetical protein